MLTLDIAKEHLGRVIEEREALGPGKPCSFDKLCEIFLKYSEDNKRSFRRDQTSLKALKSRFSAMAITEIEPRMVEEYKNHRKKEITNSSVNRELAALRTMYNKAILWKLAVRNPVKGVKFLPENKQRTRYLSQGEIKRLLDESHDHLRRIVVFALNTGMRASEIFNLTWGNVDTDQWIAEIVETKNGDIRQVPLNSEAVKAMRKSKEEGHVFTYTGKPIKRVTRSFTRACKLAGITNFRFHDLRHTWASYFMMNGGNLYDLMQMGGWKSISMVRRYSHLDTGYRRRIMEMASPTSNLGQNLGQKRFFESRETASA